MKTLSAHRTTSRLNQILVIVLTIGAFILTIQYAVVTCLASRSSDLVASIAPGNVVALRAGYRAALTAGKITPSRHRAFARRARRALRSEPLSVAALSIVGLEADARGTDVTRTRALMEAAQSVSRRNLMMELWLVEDRVAQGDAAGALRHYDRILSAYPEAEPLMFPTLASAIDGAPVRDALVGYIRTRRPWMRSFLDYATGNAKPASLIPLLIAADGPTGVSTFTRPFESGLLRNVVAQQDFARTRLLAQRLSPGAIPGWNALVPSRASSDNTLRPLTWMVSDEQVYQLGFDANGGGVLDIEPEGRGIAMYRVIFPRPGTYRLIQRLDADDADDLQARWDFTCLGTVPKALAAVPAVPPSAAAGTVIVPSGCPAVRVALVIGGSDRTGRSTLRFARFDLSLMP